MDMLKSIVIAVLAAYSLYITIKYINVNEENYRLKRKMMEFYIVPRPDTNRVYEVEARRDTVYLTKYRVVKEKDTVYVFQVVPSESGEYKVNYTWSWLDFLRIKDTILVKFDSLKRATAALYRWWRVERPVVFAVELYEKEPENYWWRGFISPPEFAEYTNLTVYNGLSSFRWYVGGGVIFNDRITPALGTAFVYKRHLLGIDVGLNNVSLYYKYRIK